MTVVNFRLIYRVVGIERRTTVMGVKWNTTTAKRIQDDTAVVSFIDSSTSNENRSVQVDGESSGVLQMVENCHIAF